MPVYMVERDLPMASVERLRAAHRAIARVAEAFAAQGKHIAHLRCIFVPQEARSVCLFEAPTAELVREVNEEAGVPFVRILEVDDFIPPGADGIHTVPKEGTSESAPGSTAFGKEYIM